MSDIWSPVGLSDILNNNDQSQDDAFVDSLDDPAASLGNFIGSQTDTVDSVDKLNDGEKLLNAPVSGSDDDESPAHNSRGKKSSKKKKQPDGSDSEYTGESGDSSSLYTDSDSDTDYAPSPAKKKKVTVKKAKAVYPAYIRPAVQPVTNYSAAKSQQLIKMVTQKQAQVIPRFQVITDARQFESRPTTGHYTTMSNDVRHLQQASRTLSTVNAESAQQPHIPKNLPPGRYIIVNRTNGNIPSSNVINNIVKSLPMPTVRPTSYLRTIMPTKACQKKTVHMTNTNHIVPIVTAPPTHASSINLSRRLVNGPDYIKPLLTKNIKRSCHSVWQHHATELSPQERWLVGDSAAYIPLNRSIWLDDPPVPQPLTDSIRTNLLYKMKAKRCMVNLSTLLKCRKCDIKICAMQLHVFHKCLKTPKSRCACRTPLYSTHFCVVHGCAAGQFPSCMHLFIHALKNHPLAVCQQCRKFSHGINSGRCPSCMFKYRRNEIRIPPSNEENRWKKGPLKVIVENGQSIKARSYITKDSLAKEICLVDDDSDSESLANGHVDGDTSIPQISPLVHDNESVDATSLVDSVSDDGSNNLLESITLKDGCINIDIDSDEERMQDHGRLSSASGHRDGKEPDNLLTNDTDQHSYSSTLSKKTISDDELNNNPGLDPDDEDIEPYPIDILPLPEPAIPKHIDLPSGGSYMDSQDAGTMSDDSDCCIVGVSKS